MCVCLCLELKYPMVRINEEMRGKEALTSQMEDVLYSVCQNRLDVQLCA